MGGCSLGRELQIEREQNGRSVNRWARTCSKKTVGRADIFEVHLQEHIDTLPLHYKYMSIISQSWLIWTGTRKSLKCLRGWLKIVIWACRIPLRCSAASGFSWWEKKSSKLADVQLCNICTISFVLFESTFQLILNCAKFVSRVHFDLLVWPDRYL